MKTRQRLTGLKTWLQTELCEGRKMKTPGEDLRDIRVTAPSVFLAWMPTRPDETGNVVSNPVNVCPGILVMPNQSRTKTVEEKRFDRYENVKRPKELGQTLAVSILMSVYEPGIRMPGYVETGDIRLVQEATEEGLYVLTDWMDELQEKLLSVGGIPDTDLFVNTDSMIYSLYTDQSFVVDKRPIYYGFVNVEFVCYANMTPNNSIDQYLI